MYTHKDLLCMKKDWGLILEVQYQLLHMKNPWTIPHKFSSHDLAMKSLNFNAQLIKVVNILQIWNMVILGHVCFYCVLYVL